MNNSTKFVPEPYEVNPNDHESLSVWGFDDTKFVFDGDGDVQLSGKRYELCGQKLNRLLPWINDVMEVSLSQRTHNPPQYPPRIPTPVVNEHFVKEIRTFFKPGQLESDGEIRLRHGHGHTQFEMYAIKHDAIKRVPDLVVYPEEEDQIVDLVEAAREQDVCLIPYGGGTNVTEALLCPENESRMIVSVDMVRMNKILWIDKENKTACIQAGAVGRHIMTELEKHGVTMGHEPDSVEFSTLGGWIATNASGMKKNRYGNIEDIVLDMNVVTTDGLLKRSFAAPRESCGIDPRRLMFGSEGNFGIITSAVVKLFNVPEVKKYGSILFKTFEDGVAYLNELTKMGVVPASPTMIPIF